MIKGFDAAVAGMEVGEIREIHLLEKSGGKSGKWVR